MPIISTPHTPNYINSTYNSAFLREQVLRREREQERIIAAEAGDLNQPKEQRGWI